MKKIAFILAAASLMSVAACTKTPEAAAVEEGGPETLEESQSQVPMADTMPMTNDSGSDAEDRSELANQEEAEDAAMAAQRDADDAENNPIRLMNPGSTQDVYIYQDRATGCEFIQYEERSDHGDRWLPRPNGKGGQRGCGTGDDFNKEKNK